MNSHKQEKIDHTHPHLYWKRSIHGLSFLFILITLLAFGAQDSFSQTLITGKVVDSASGLPVPFSSIGVVGKNTGDLSKEDGSFQISTSLTEGSLRITSTGYRSKIIKFNGNGTFTVKLAQAHEELKAFTITSKREKYRNKNNPAVSLIRQVLAHKKENQPIHYDHVQYNEYNRSVVYLQNPGKLFKKNFLFKKYQFFFDNADTTTIEGSELVPIYLEETVNKKFLNKDPSFDKTILVSSKRTNLNKKFVNNKSMGAALKYIYQDIDLYQSTIYLLTTNFMSPISALGPQFYRYFITDTIKNDPSGYPIVKLAFEPRNNFDQLFVGTLYIALNGHYSLQRADISMPRVANVNWVKNLNAELYYKADPTGKYYLERSDLGVEFGIPTVKLGAYALRTIIISDFNSEDSLSEKTVQNFKETLPPNDTDALDQNTQYLENNRPIELGKVLTQTYVDMDSLNHIHSFERLLDWGSFIFSGYKQWGPFEIGPFSRFYSFNQVEGFRPRLGARSTDRFSQRLYIRGDIAYGTRDKKIKYYGSAAYSFNRKNVFQGYPNHYFQITTFFDTRIPGRVFTFEDEASIFFSFKRGDNDRYLYSRMYRADYVNELIPHLRFNLSLQRHQQEAGGSLHFVSNETTPGQTGNDTIKSVTTGGLGLSVRWAPGEKFLTSKTIRKTLPNHNPIFTLSSEFGFKNFLGGNYKYQKYEFDIYQRLFLTKFGVADIWVNSGYISGKVPFPFLFIPQANQSYVFDRLSFNMMNSLEYISDHFVSINIDYHMKGLIFNNIPFIKWLRLREVAGFRAVYGGLRDENAREIFALPVNNEGEQTTFTLGNKPYMEFNVGIENIFNLIRIDYVQRLNYLGHPGTVSHGVRFSLTASF